MVRYRHLEIPQIALPKLNALGDSEPQTERSPRYKDAYNTPPAPELYIVNPNGRAGNWYTGAVPADGGLSKPVLVFVQGLHDTATEWFQNGMYTVAYNNGYRTAFVQLADADGKGGSIQQNSAILAKQLQEITNYYGVEQVDIIAHSKGGNDTQGAIVYDGASQYIREVFELATPNYGSQLADLAYSWWAGWLAALLGYRNDAVHDLQTAYMSFKIHILGTVKAIWSLEAIPSVKTHQSASDDVNEQQS